MRTRRGHCAEGVDLITKPVDVILAADNPDELHLAPPLGKQARHGDCLQERQDEGDASAARDAEQVDVVGAMEIVVHNGLTVRA